jgi:hypothetical protein
MDYDLKDSGTRRTFDTGAKRDAATGKGRYDLISPLALRRLAVLLEKGAVKYDARNWEKGMPLSVFFDCAVRHLYKHLAGMRDEDHLAAAMWNVQAIMHFEEMIARGLKPAELNDLPSYEPPEGDGLYHVEVLVPCDGAEPTWVEQGGGRESQSVAQGAALWLHGKEMYPMVRVVRDGATVLELVR